MKVFLSSSQHYDIIASDVISNTNILRECIALTHNLKKILKIKNIQKRQTTSQ